MSSYNNLMMKMKDEQTFVVQCKDQSEAVRDAGYTLDLEFKVF